MADLQIGDELSAALHKMAASENLSVEALIAMLLERYQIEKDVNSSSADDEGWRGEALDGLIGMFEDEYH